MLRMTRQLRPNGTSTPIVVQQAPVSILDRTTRKQPAYAGAGDDCHSSHHHYQPSH